MTEELKEYFRKIPREQVLKDWEATAEWDNINVSIEYKISAIEKQIKSDLPYLLEVKKGCKFEFKKGYEFEIGKRLQGEIINIDFFNNVLFISMNTLQTCSLETIKDSSTTKIIGHDITLFDFFEWLNKMNVVYTIAGKYICFVEFKPYIDKSEFELDFTKPLFKQQNKDLIDFAYEHLCFISKNLKTQ